MSLKKKGVQSFEVALYSQANRILQPDATADYSCTSDSTSDIGLTSYIVQFAKYKEKQKYLKNDIGTYKKSHN